MGKDPDALGTRTFVAFSLLSELGEIDGIFTRHLERWRSASETMKEHARSIDVEAAHSDNDEEENAEDSRTRWRASRTRLTMRKDG